MIRKKFFFRKSKAEVLIDLKRYNLKFKIPKTIIFFAKQWKIEKTQEASEIYYDLTDLTSENHLLNDDISLKGYGLGYFFLQNPN